VRLRLFARAREAAGCAAEDIEVKDAPTLGDLLDAVRLRHGGEFGAILDASRVWLNGDEPAEGPATRLTDGDEVAVLPPVSGG